MAADSTFTLTQEILARCDQLARFSESPLHLTRTFLSEPMKGVHDLLSSWMREAGMSVRVDAIGNLIGHYPGQDPNGPVFLMGSHLDTVPNAGKYDGILGVLLAVAAVRALNGERLPFGIDVLAFSEEEGIRFRASYLGSTALCGCFDQALLQRLDSTGLSMEQAIRQFGLDPEQIATARYPRKRVLGYLEAHIEQGPILEDKGLALGVVEAIVGQSRSWLTFEGKAGHAGTQPMELRRDALAAAAEFVLAVEKAARETEGLRATVGEIGASPGAVNVVPGLARVSLDVRHGQDAVRLRAVESLLGEAQRIGAQRRINVRVERSEHHEAVASDGRLTRLLHEAAKGVGQEPLRMVSGAGHDAAIMARLTPMTMLFLRSPGGISHHPDEAVHLDDVVAALNVMVAFLRHLVGDSK